MKISQLLARGRPTVSFEFFPPKTPQGETNLMRTIDALRPLAPDAEENSSDSMAPVVIGAKQLARDSGAAGH